MLEQLTELLFGQTEYDPSRRSFLRTAAQATAVIAVGGIISIEKLAEAKTPHAKPLRSTKPLPAKPAGEVKYDVSLLWHPDLDEVLDYQEAVSRRLGAKQARNLQIVRGKKNYGLIFNVDGNRITAISEGRNLAHKLRRLGGAVSIADEGYEQLWNISYGRGKNLKELKKSFAVVYGTLGDGLGKDLFVEKVNGDYALVYRRRGDRSSTFERSRAHKELLRSKGLDATIIAENNNPVVYGISSYLDNEAEPQAETEVEPDIPPVVPPKTTPKTTPKKIPTPPKRNPLSIPVENPAPIGNNLEKLIRAEAKGKLASDETLAVRVYDIGSQTVLADIRSGQIMQTASMVKPYVALAYFHKVEQGKLSYNKDAKKHMRKMIQKSNNNSTNWLIGKVGGAAAVNKLIHENYDYVCKDCRIVESIPGGGRTYRNKASAKDHSRFLYALWKDQLPNSREIRRLMALPGRDRLYTGARRVPAGTRVYNKTGSTSRLCGDMGILVAKDPKGHDHPYIVVGIVEKAHRAKNYSSWIASRGNLIREISNLAYDAMERKYKL